MSDEVIQQLSEREREILVLVASGASNKAIAQALYISANTVKVHLHNIFTKIGANSRTEAALIAIRAGLYHPSQDVSEDLGNLPSNMNPGPVVIDQKTLTKATADEIKWFQAGWVPVVGVLTIAVLILLILLTLRQAFPPDKPTTTLVSVVVNPSFVWETNATPAQGARLPAVVVSGGIVYLIGGEDENGVSGRMQRLILAEEKWETLPDKPTPVTDFQAGILDDSLYAPGGRAQSGEILKTMEVFSLEKGVWENGPPLPNPISRFAITAFADSLYLFGGWDGTQYLTQILRYNPQTNLWESQGYMPVATADSIAFVSGNTIHLMGGTSEQGRLDSTWIFTPGENGGVWKTGEKLPIKAQNLCAANILDFTYLFTYDQGKPQTEMAWQHTGEPGGWFSYPLPTQSIQDCRAFAIGTRVFIYSHPDPGSSLPVLQSIQAIYTTHIPNVRQPEEP